MKKGDVNYYSWLIAFIDVTFLDKVENELKKNPEWSEVDAYIPTVKILKKTLKNKDYFEEVPLLFNYGFFRVPRKFAIHEQFLENLKSGISCIYGWVRDPLKTIEEKPRLRLDEKSVYDDKEISVATASSEEIQILVKQSFNLSVHPADEVERLGPGSIITLRGYPWEGLQAQIISIDTKRKQMKVKINMMNMMRDVKVSFDNVFYTIYHGKSWDDSVSIVDSLDATMELGIINKRTAKNYKDGD